MINGIELNCPSSWSRLLLQSRTIWKECTYMQIHTLYYNTDDILS